MSNVGNSIDGLIKKTTNEKEYLEKDGVLALDQQIVSHTSSSIDRMLKRSVAQQSSSAANETSIGQKKPRNHVETLSALKEAHQKKCQQLLDHQKTLIGYFIELQTKITIISQNPVANMHTELEEIAQKYNDAQSHFTASSRQLKIENEKLKFNINRYVAQYMVDKDSNKNTVTIKTTKSFESYLRASKIKQSLEIVEYIDKNLTDDQLTVEFLDHLDESSQQKPFKEPVTVALFKQMEDLKYLVKADNKLNKIVSDRVDIIRKLTKLVGQEEANGNWQIVEIYKQMISGEQQVLNDSLDQAVKHRQLYATKYCPEQKDDFVDEMNLPALLDDLYADVEDQEVFTSKKTLRDRLRHLLETLSKEYEVITSIEPTLTSPNCSGPLDTFFTQKNIDPENDEVVVQVVGGENAIAHCAKIDKQT